MPISVNWGGNAMLALGREAGIAQGQAEAARIEAEGMRQMRESLFAGINDAARSLASGIIGRQQLKERQKDRDLRDTISQRSSDTRYDIADANRDARLESDRLKADTQMQVAGLRGDYGLETQKLRNTGRLENTTLLETGRNDRLGVTEGGKNDRFGQGMVERIREHDDKMVVQQQEQDRRQKDSEARRAKLDMDLAQEKDQEKAKRLLHDFVDSEHQQNGGGEPTIDQMNAHAEIDQKGFLSPQTRIALGGKNAAKLPPSENYIATIAATEPRQLKRVAATTYRQMDPSTKLPSGPPIPTQAALKAQAAMQQLANSPRFTPEGGGVDYFTNLQKTRDQYSQEAGTDPIMHSVVQQLDQKIAAEKMKRWHTILPRIHVQIENLPDEDGLSMLRKNGITAQEYFDYMTNMRDSPELYAPAGGGGTR